MPPELYSPGASAHHSTLANPRQLSVLSHNILLPSSVDGWWTYKNYCPITNPIHQTWPARQSLLASIISTECPDIICYQESSERSYATDFPHLESTGYSTHVHAKGRFRPQTFWRGTAFSPLVPTSFSKDHTLITPLTITATNQTVWIVNCHLLAGGDDARRLRQLHDAVEVVRKKAVALKVSDNFIILAGDMNCRCDGESVTGRYLLNGIVEAQPLVSSKDKTHKYTFGDAYADCYGTGKNPTTLIAPALIPRMIKEVKEGKIVPTLAMRKAARLVFDVYADFCDDGSSDYDRMSRKGVEKWLLDINKSTERGDEMRNAFSLLEDKKEEDDKWLSPADFLSLYLKELKGGKFWGVASDFAFIAETYGLSDRLIELDVLPEFYITKRQPAGEEEEDRDLFKAVFDYMFYTTDSLRLEGVLDVAAERKRPIPDEHQPSDHFAIKACFTLREKEGEKEEES